LWDVSSVDSHGGDGRSVEPGSAWAPFRNRSFAAMRSAQFASNIGSWMETVAAQWLMLSLASSATYVALVQTAASPFLSCSLRCMQERPAISWTTAIFSHHANAGADCRGRPRCACARGAGHPMGAPCVGLRSGHRPGPDFVTIESLR